MDGHGLKPDSAVSCDAKHQDEEDASTTDRAGTEGAAFDHGISLTALWAGYHRIMEMAQPRPLFFDPLAKALMGEANAKQAYERMTAELEDSIFMKKQAFVENEATFFPVRHRFFDDFIYRTLDNHIIQSYKTNGEAPWQLQVVDMACGFDGRAFRLRFPADTIFWELDRQEVLDVKNRRIGQLHPIPQITCQQRICLPVDLITDDWEGKLIATGFNPELPTVWVMEGIMTYIPEDALVALLQRIKAVSAHGSAILGDIINSATRYNFVIQKRTALLAKDDAAYRLHVDDPEKLWRKCGIHESRYYFLGDPLVSYEGRYPPCSFMKLMHILVRIAMGLAYGALGIILGHFVAWYVALPATVGFVIIFELLTGPRVEQLARFLKMAFWPSAYFVEGRI